MMIGNLQASTHTCLLFPKSIEERVETNALIVEGQVIEKQSYWDDTHQRIYTSNTILVYKVFKGELTTDQIIIITDGGIVGDEMHIANPSLQLTEGNIGLFFLENTTEEKKNKASSIKSQEQFYAFENGQAFIQYDVMTGAAKGVFKNYQDIQKEIYQVVAKKTQKQFTEFNTFNAIGKQSQEKPQNNQEGSEKSMLVPAIDCMYPNIISAGTKSVLSIFGDDFGGRTSTCKIKFKNPDDGGTTFVSVPSDHILTWENNFIEVVVPTKAGSGPVSITDASGTTILTPEIMIPYARATVGDNLDLSYMIGENGSGGYTLKYSTSTSYSGVNFTNSGAVPAFERAMTDLQTYIGFNVQMGGNTNTNTVGNDGENVVMFDNGSNPLAAAGLLYSQYTGCGGGWELAGMDVVFRRPATGYPNLNWNFSANPPNWDQIDFQSVAIHELMHGLQLRHVVEEEAVMYFAYAFGVMRREIGPCYDYRGAMEVTEASLAFQPWCSGNSKYTLHPNYNPNMMHDNNCASPVACSQMPQNESEGGFRVQAKILLEGFYNGGDKMNNTLYMNDLLPANQPFNQDPWFYNGDDNLSGTEKIPSESIDWVLIELFSGNNQNLVGRRAAFLNRDGYLVDIDGTQGVHFNNVEAGNYYVVIRHCSHLAISSKAPISYPNENIYDFTTGTNTAMGNGQLKYIGGNYAMYAGDYDNNGVINAIDFNLWGQNNALVSVYLPWDGDGSGVINNLDFNLWTGNKSKIGADIIGL